MRFTDYQNLGDGIKHRLAEQQKGSKFWEKGKWDNYIAPLLPKKPRNLTFIDMGCNGGLFLKYAEDMGFKKVYGVDINPDVVERGKNFRDREKGNWDIRAGKMQEVIDDLPVADYMVFSNSHYYLLIKDWLNLVDKLRNKARYVIITAVRKYQWYCMASGRGRDIQKYFKDWDVIGHIPQLSVEDDSCPRSLSTICYKNRYLNRVKLKDLKKGAHVKTDFHEEIAKGVDPLKTKYFRRLVANHKKSRKEDLIKKMYKKVALYYDIKQNGIRDPLIINKNMRMLDGNHRAKIWEFLGHESIIARIT